jgi:hypothetical protein
MLGDGTNATRGLNTTANRGAMRFVQGTTGKAHYEFPTDIELTKGKLVGVRYHTMMETANTGTKAVVFTLKLFKNSNNSVGTVANLTDVSSVVINNNAHWVRISEEIFSSPLTIAKGDHIGVRVERTAGATDTALGVCGLLSMELIYEADINGEGPFEYE